MRVIIAEKLYVEDATQECFEWCRQNLVLSNPDYYQKQKMGKWTGNTPKEISLYEKMGDHVWLPFGCYVQFFRQFPNTPYKAVFGSVRHFDYKSSINLYDYQEKAVQAILERKNGVLVAGCGSGKGLPLDAKIYTPNGWVRNGDLKIGDKVIGSDGNAINVTGIHDKGEVSAYKITFSDETSVICDKDHLWTVQKQRQRSLKNRKWFVENTESIYKQYQKILRQDLLYIPVVEPVNFNKKDITLEPWLLGFLLGDGCFQKGTVFFSTNEQDILNKVFKIVCNRFGDEEKIYIKNGRKHDYRFSGANILFAIRNLGLGQKHSYEKFVPENYKYNTIKVRLSVLQGLFDADGCISGKGIYEYSTSSEQLANDIVEIVQSLGGIAKIRTKTPTYTYKGEKRVGRKSYRVFFKLYKFKPFTSEKHKQKYTKRTKYVEPYRIIKKIEPCENIISRCITVDAADELYVTDGFVVTHNTQMGLEIIARIGGRALWLTHTQDLLNQSMNRAKSVFGASLNSYGTITEGKVNVGKGLTFATIQTLCNIDIENYKDYWDVVVVDECAHCAGSPTKVTQFYKVLSNLRARYKIGLTATPKRADGLERSMFALLGDKVIEIDRSEIADTTCEVKVMTLFTGYMPNLDFVLTADGTIDYSKLVEDMIQDKDRFDLVQKVVNSVDGPAIVLANRVEYLKRLTDACKLRSVCLSALGQSKAAKEERKSALEKLNNGELDVVFCTYQLAAEGLDVPGLQYVILATPEKDPSRIQQSSGRVARKADGKEYGTVVDLVDEFGMYKAWYSKRLWVYKKLGYDIM